VNRVASLLLPSSPSFSPRLGLPGGSITGVTLQASSRYRGCSCTRDLSAWMHAGATPWASGQEVVHCCYGLHDRYDRCEQPTGRVRVRVLGLTGVLARVC